MLKESLGGGIEFFKACVAYQVSVPPGSCVWVVLLDNLGIS